MFIIFNWILSACASPPPASPLPPSGQPVELLRHAIASVPSAEAVQNITLNGQEVSIVGKGRHFSGVRSPLSDLESKLMSGKHMASLQLDTSVLTWLDVEGVQSHGFLFRVFSDKRTRGNTQVEDALSVLESDEVRFLWVDALAESLTIHGVASSSEAVDDLLRVTRLSPCVVEPTIASKPFEGDPKVVTFVLTAQAATAWLVGGDCRGVPGDDRAALAVLVEDAQQQGITVARGERPESLVSVVNLELTAPWAVLWPWLETASLLPVKQMALTSEGDQVLASLDVWIRQPLYSRADLRALKRHQAQQTGAPNPALTAVLEELLSQEPVRQVIRKVRQLEQTNALLDSAPAELSELELLERQELLEQLELRTVEHSEHAKRELGMRTINAWLNRSGMSVQQFTIVSQEWINPWLGKRVIEVHARGSQAGFEEQLAALEERGVVLLAHATTQTEDHVQFVGQFQVWMVASMRPELGAMWRISVGNVVDSMGTGAPLKNPFEFGPAHAEQYQKELEKLRRRPLMTHPALDYEYLGMVQVTEGTKSRGLGLVKAPNGGFHTVGDQHYLGMHWGKVTSINADHLWVEEEHQSIHGDRVIAKKKLVRPTLHAGSAPARSTPLTALSPVTPDLVRATLSEYRQPVSLDFMGIDLDSLAGLFSERLKVPVSVEPAVALSSHGVSFKCVDLPIHTVLYMVQMAMLESGVILDESLTFRLDPEAALAHQESMQPATVTPLERPMSISIAMEQVPIDVVNRLLGSVLGLSMVSTVPSGADIRIDLHHEGVGLMALLESINAELQHQGARLVMLDGFLMVMPYEQ